MVLEIAYGSFYRSHFLGMTLRFSIPLVRLIALILEEIHGVHEVGLFKKISSQIENSFSRPNKFSGNASLLFGARIASGSRLLRQQQLYSRFVEHSPAVIVEPGRG